MCSKFLSLRNTQFPQLLWSTAKIISHFHHRKYWTNIFSSVEQCLEWTLNYSLLKKSLTKPTYNSRSVFWTLKCNHFCFRILKKFLASRSLEPGSPLGLRGLLFFSLPLTTTGFFHLSPTSCAPISLQLSRFVGISDFITLLRKI